jgi:AcrR family transcriptional regulator
MSTMVVSMMTSNWASPITASAYRWRRSGRFDVTKDALYYHFRTKEDIVASPVGDLAASLDEVLAWARGQEDHQKAREELIRRIAALTEGRFGPLMRFLQENQPALGEFHDRNPLVGRMQELPDHRGR